MVYVSKTIIEDLENLIDNVGEEPMINFDRVIIEFARAIV